MRSPGAVDSGWSPRCVCCPQLAAAGDFHGIFSRCHFWFAFYASFIIFPLREHFHSTFFPSNCAAQKCSGAVLPVLLGQHFAASLCQEWIPHPWPAGSAAGAISSSSSLLQQGGAVLSAPAWGLSVLHIQRSPHSPAQPRAPVEPWMISIFINSNKSKEWTGPGELSIQSN